MTTQTLAQLASKAPKLANAKHARLMLDHLIEKAQNEAPALVDRLALPHVHKLALGIADHSPYLWQIMQRDPVRLLRLLDQAPEEALDHCLSFCWPTPSTRCCGVAVMDALSTISS